jgi:rubredoxin
MLISEGRVMKFICTLCNYVLEEAQGLPAGGIEPGTKFDNLPEDWKCPDCAAAKEYFQSCSCVSLPVYEATKVAPTQARKPAHTCT